jgi:hypothetical protein
MKACKEIHRQLRLGTGLGPADEPHLFVCPACRKRARSDRAEREIEGLATWSSSPAMAVVAPDFVSRVMRGLPLVSPARARKSVAYARWAAALAIFSAAAGYGYTVGADTAAAGQQVATPSAPSSDDIASFAF